MITKNFSKDEVACKCGCGLADIDLKFMLRVQDLRTAYGKPMVVLSGVRCPKHNADVGGANASFHRPVEGHRKAMALDIKISSGGDRWEFLRLASQAFSGIGIHEHYIHIDGRISDGVCWVY